MSHSKFFSQNSIARIHCNTYAVTMMTRFCILFEWNKSQGWTVTLAGTYSDDMAPDVQMHLSFPKRTSSLGKKIDKSINNNRSIEQANTETELDTNSNYNDTDSQKPDSKPALLPPPTPHSINSMKLNPKRSLTKNHLSTGIVSQ